MASVKKTARKASHGLLDTVAKHPVGTAAVVAGTVAGVVLARKAVNTAAKVVTIRAVGRASKDVADAVNGSRGSRGPSRSCSCRTMSKRSHRASDMRWFLPREGPLPLGRSRKS